MTEIPLGIFGLRNLKYLVLSYNQISEIPDYISELRNLQYLDMSNNRITRVSTNIQQLNQLVILNLADNPMECMEDIRVHPNTVINEPMSVSAQYYIVDC
jgi:Leucine-rich repeat (LRR) protein